MEFKISRDELFKALSKNLSIAERRTTKPILQNSLFQVDNGALVTFATDLEVNLEATYEADITESGSITLPTKKLYEIARALDPADVEFKLIDNFQVEIISQRIKYVISGLSPEDFPERIKDEEGEYFELEMIQLREMIRKTIFAASGDENKKNLNGVYLHKISGEGGSGDILRMVATDGHRMAMYSLGLEGREIPLDKGVIIPRKGILELNKMLEDGEGSVNISVPENNIIFKTESMKLSVLLVQGTYPDYDRVIPGENKNNVTLIKEEFIKGLRRMIVVLAEKSKGIKLIFNSDKLNLLAKNPGKDDGGEEEIDVEYEGSEISLGFNAKYLQEIAGVIDSDKILLELSDDFAPGIIKAAEGEEEFMSVLMPMKIGF